jgi:hypothetical protein
MTLLIATKDCTRVWPSGTSRKLRFQMSNMKVNVRKRVRKAGMKGKVTRRGISGGYEVIGWRDREDANWHVKVSPVGRPSGWIGYSVTAGIFELKMVAPAHREAVLHMIGEWELNSRPCVNPVDSDGH